MYYICKFISYLTHKIKYFTFTLKGKQHNIRIRRFLRHETASIYILNPYIRWVIVAFKLLQNLH